jgi:hypothetical protein
MSIQFDNAAEDGVIPCFDDYVSLGEKRKERHIYIPESADVPKYNIIEDEFISLFNGFQERMAQAPPSPDEPLLKDWKIKGREVGDDRLDMSNSNKGASLLLTVQETLPGMKTSEEDSGITNDTWNFTEVTTGIPCSRGTMYNAARKSDNFKNLEFVDTAPLRVVLDTSRVERIHSTSYKGKASILGGKMRTTNAISSSYLQVANLFQDACLAVGSGTEPKYLPSTLGGCHCPAQYSDPENTFLFMKAFKGGNCGRIYGTATEEAREAIRLNESGRPTPMVIAECLRDDHELHFGTFAQMVAVPDKELLLRGKEDTPEPLYKRVGVKNEVSSMEARLVQAKRLIPEAQASVEIEKKTRINNYLFKSIDIIGHKQELSLKSRLSRKQLSGALSGNAAFMNLLDRKGSTKDITQLFNEGWRPCVNGQTEFTMEHAIWLDKGARGEYMALFDIPCTADMYVRSEVSIEESLKVGGILLTASGSKPLTQKTITKVGLYEISQTMEEWCDEKMSQLTTIRNEMGRPLIRSEVLSIACKNREWINDDNALTEQCIEDTKHASRSTQVCLISSDKSLANKMSRQANVKVVLVEPTSLLKIFPEKRWSCTTSLTADEVYNAYPTNTKESKHLIRPMYVYIDSGSLCGQLAIVDRKVDNAGKSRFFRIECIATGFTPEGRRFETQQRSEILLTSYLRVKLYDPARKDPFKISKKFFGRDTASRENSRWSHSAKTERIERRSTKFRSTTTL